MLEKVKLNYEIQGEGPVIVLIHGLGQRLEEWRFQINDFLAAGFQVLRFDLRGHGKSDFNLNEEISIDTYAHDMNVLLLKLQIEKAHIIGFSLGGLVAQAFYRFYVEKVNSLVLVATYASLPEPLRSEFLEERLILIDGENGMDKLGRMVAERSFTPQASPEIVKAMENLVASNDLAAYRAAIIAGGMADSTDILDNIKVPCLIIVGEDDITTPPAFSYFLHENIEDSILEIVPEVRHLLIQEKAEIFNNKVLCFLKTLKR